MPVKSETARIRILIVEDSATQRLELKNILEKNGYLIAEAKSAEDALDYLSSNIPSVVISDIIMPGMDGYNLCRTIKADKRLRDMPVILLTTLSDPDDVLEGLDCGADSFMTKPYNESFLLSRIEFMLLNQEVRKVHSTDMGIEMVFEGKKRYITSSRMQILDMLISTYEAAVIKNRDLEKINRELREANEKIRTLSGLIPICSVCKKIRKDDGYWEQLEKYITEHSDAVFSHGYCPDCGAEVNKRIKKLK